MLFKIFYPIINLFYRTGFDISLPTYSIIQETPSRTISKRWLLTVPQKMVRQDQKLSLQMGSQNSTKNISFVESCDEKNICKIGGTEVSYSEAFESSTFCLILKLGKTLSNPALVSTN